MDKTRNLLIGLLDVELLLRFSVEDMVRSLDFAKFHHNRISNPNAYTVFGKDDPADEIEYSIEEAAQYTEDFYFHLKEFDKELAKLIELRGKLAEEVGIPMMSHMGTKKFARHDKEYTL